MSERELGEGWFSAESISFDNEGVVVYSTDKRLEACAKDHLIKMDRGAKGYFKFPLGWVRPCPPPPDGAPKCEHLEKKDE